MHQNQKVPWNIPWFPRWWLHLPSLTELLTRFFSGRLGSCLLQSVMPSCPGLWCASYYFTFSHHSLETSYHLTHHPEWTQQRELPWLRGWRPAIVKSGSDQIYQKLSWMLSWRSLEKWFDFPRLSGTTKRLCFDFHLSGTTKRPCTSPKSRWKAPRRSSTAPR